MKTTNRLSILAVSVFALMCGNVNAAPPVPDQFSPAAVPIPHTLVIGGGGGQVLYQSFTVGLTGRLTEIRLPIGCGSGALVVEIFDADSDELPVAGLRPRLTRSFAANLFPVVVTGDFEPLPLGGRVGVIPGDRLVMVLSNPTGSCGIVPSVAGDGYSDSNGLGRAHFAEAVNLFEIIPLDLGNPAEPNDLPFQTLVRRTGRP